MLLRLIAVGLCAAVAAAQNPADAADADVVKRGLTAAVALSKLADAIEADRAALADGAKDAVRARAATRHAVESRPAPPDLAAITEDDVRRLAAALSEAEGAAASRAKGMTTLAAILEGRASLLRSAVERCDELERGPEQRAWLAELKRRVDGGQVSADKVAVDGKPVDLARPIERIDAVCGSLSALRASLEAELAQVVAERDALAASEARPDAAGMRARVVIDVLARALGLEANERAEILKPDGDFGATLPRLAEDWKRDRGRLTAAQGRVDARSAELAALDDERSRLEPPDPRSIPEGDGHAELRKARRAAELSSRLVAWQERRVDLLGRSRGAAEVLKAELEKLSELSDAVLRSSSRLRAMVARLEEARAAGRPLPVSAPDGMSAASLWEGLRALAFLEADRRARLAAVETRLVKPVSDPDAGAALAAERANLKRFQATLADEESYARFLQEMAALSEDDLLRLLSPDGTIAKAIAAKETEARKAEAEVAKHEQDAVRVRRDVIGAIENPYAEMGIRKNAARAEEIRREVEGLKDGALPADRSTVTLGTLPDDRPPLSSADEAAPDAIRRVLEAEQAFSKELRHYFADLRKGVADWKEALAALDAAVDRQGVVLGDLVNEKKRAYAAARELERRQAGGKVAPGALPAGFAALLTREPIAAVVARRDEELRRHETLRGRRAADLKGLEEVAGIDACVDERSLAADRKAGTIAQPIAHLEAARKPFADLPEVERKQLEYQADVRKSRDDRWLDRVFIAIAQKDTRAQFEAPLKAHYLELVTSERSASEQALASAGFEKLAEIAIGERESLACLPTSLKESEDTRILQYQNARHLAAIAASPDRHVEIENAFKARFGRELLLPADNRGWSKLHWADNLFAAEMRLWGHRRWLRDSETFLSKLGSEAEIARYRRQVAKIRADEEVAEARSAKLATGIEELRASYVSAARLDSVLGLGKALLILAVAWGLVSVIRRVRRKVLNRPASGPGPDESDRSRRLHTITKVASTALIGVIYATAGMYILGRLGVDITPLLASAGVAGLAIAFGAQTLIRDYLSGFFILIENQFTIGDVIDVGGVSGVVESITLRVTVLRDAEGVVHYVPNGTLARVSNKTQGWSRSVVDVGVGYGENLDRVTEVLKRTLAQLQAELPWKFLILEEPTVLGVEQLSDSSINFRVSVTCRPGKQWDLSRELRKRIKRAFDDAGIQIPYPQRVVHHVYEEGGPLGHPARLDAGERGAGR